MKRTDSKGIGAALVGVGVFLCVLRLPALAAGCVGDCSGNNEVTVTELLSMVNMALNDSGIPCTAADANDDGKITVPEIILAVNAILGGCLQPTPTATPGGSGSCSSGTQFNSTFEGIQKVVFERHQCTEAACHGGAKQGGLDLSPNVAYENLVEVASSQSHLNRVEPGDKDRSFLWLKLALATSPSSLPVGVQVAGAPMPNGLPPISADELEAVRLWIYGGAPKTGTVGGTDKLLNACLPVAKPITIKPLDPPAQGEGVQFIMPPWHLEAHSEHEICFATYYDITDQVPQEFRDPSGTMFRFNANELRQDPQSHHLILNRFVGSTADIHDSSFGTWKCNGGDKAGQECEPTDLTSCGAGICTSEIQQTFACLGFGPQTGGPSYYAIGGAQAAQAHNEYVDGVFAQIPMKGVLYWNSHAFNLTDEDTLLHARLNYYFANNPKYPVQGIFDTTKIFAANAAPYTTQTLCNDFVIPRGARLFNLSSHTHRHGKHFTVSMANGDLIYENFIYNDPANVNFSPPLAFDSASLRSRTLHFCSLYNNGMKGDGSPDPVAVTRRSRVPESARLTFGDCSPVACAAGNVGAPCNGVDDDRACDSSPGANDGLCDACRITGGESTENEMFILIGSYFLAPSGDGAGGSGASLDAAGRSTSTELALGAQPACSSSHAGHGAMHANHH